MESWLVQELVSHILFLLVLLICYILLNYGYWPDVHHKKVDLPKEARRRVSCLVEETWKDLLTLVKDVIDCQLEDGEIRLSSTISPGIFDFSIRCKAAESKLFDSVKNLMTRINPEEEVFLLRCLKMKIMTTAHDMRGSRRLSVLCDFIQVGSGA